ncbi:MAG: hypothetical protein AB1634_05250 [Thermodesulfobacteriota bacterium]
MTETADNSRAAKQPVLLTNVLGQGADGSAVSLRPGYAYLLRSRLTVPELYFWLGELLFCSQVGGAEEGDKQGAERWPNLVGLFIDDTKENLFTTLFGVEKFAKDKDPTETFVNLLQGVQGAHDGQFAAWLDTQGQFGSEAGSQKGYREARNGRRSRSLAGSGNPMSVFRFYREVSELEATSELNLYLLNSLSNMHRSLGLSDTSAFLKTILASIWGGEEAATGGETDDKKIKSKDSAFFAVLQEGVLQDEETQYLESFFDGVIRFDPLRFGPYRVPLVRVASLPLAARLPPPMLFWPERIFTAEDEQSLFALPGLTELGLAGAAPSKGVFIQILPIPDDHRRDVERLVRRSRRT